MTLQGPQCVGEQCVFCPVSTIGELCVVGGSEPPLVGVWDGIEGGEGRVQSKGEGSLAWVPSLAL